MDLEKIYTYAACSFFGLSMLSSFFYWAETKRFRKEKNIKRISELTPGEKCSVRVVLAEHPLLVK